MNKIKQNSKNVSVTTTKKPTKAKQSQKKNEEIIKRIFKK